MFFFNKNAKLLKEAQLELSRLREQNNELTNRNNQLKDAEQRSEIATAHNKELIEKYAAFIDKDRVLKDKEQSITDAESKLLELNKLYQAALKIHGELKHETDLYQDNLDIGSFGLYQPRYAFETSEKFKNAIDNNYEKQKQLIKSGESVVCKIEWTVGGSKAEGRKMTNQYKKLMLYAFNGECDGLIAKVKWNNALKSKERILRAFEAINKLGETQSVFITTSFLNLKLDELALTYEYEQKKYEEKEEQKRIREQMRDEEKAQRELERAQKDAEDEEKRFQKALDKAKQQLTGASQAELDILNEQVKSLEIKLKEAQERKERAISLAQLTKVGHIYVISNIGSFGEDVYKIGMTRRLDPLDRVKELGDASVPFQFDVHAIIYSENAPQLEYELHRKFGDNRLNRINNKKEFFRVSLNEIEDFVKMHANAEIEFTMLAEAREYRETLTLLKTFTEHNNSMKGEVKFPESILS
jgi:hypothetical protein